MKTIILTINVHSFFGRRKKAFSSSIHQIYKELNSGTIECLCLQSYCLTFRLKNQRGRTLQEMNNLTGIS